MTMRSPVLAMLWEQWRLTRAEAAQRLSLGIVGGSAVLTWSDWGATLAFWLVLSQFAMFWMSIAKLNGGSFLDGYKPGFPLQLLYTRPIPTVVFVGVAMAYDALSGAAMYLASAALLGLAFGQPFPLLSVAVWIVAFHLVSTCVQWSTRNRVVQWVGSFAICVPLFFLLMHRAESSPPRVEFSPAEYAVMVSIGLVSIGLTVAGVTRQRRGDAVSPVPGKEGWTGDPDWLVGLIPCSCPVSSARRAQVWFDLKSSGVGVLVIGAALAIANPLLFALGIPVAWFRPYAVFFAMLSGLAVLVLGGNAFGMRRKQGRRYASAFAATQPYGAAGLAGVKVLVRSVCVLAALVAVAASVWGSSSLVGRWHYAAGDPATSAVLLSSAVSGERFIRNLLQLRSAIGGAIGGLTGYELAALTLVTSIGIAVMVALRASIEALRAHYRRRVRIAGAVVLLYCLALVLLAVAAQFGSGPAVFVNAANAAFFATPWLAAAALMLATIYLFRSVLAERILSLRHAGGAVLMASAFAVAWVTLLRAGGGSLAAIPAGVAVWLLTPALLTLMASVLAPWSLSRVHHT